MSLYRGGFFKKGSPEPPPVEPTRRIARSSPTDKHRPDARSEPTDSPRPDTPLAARPATSAAPRSAPVAATRDPLSSPVVGWLAIIAGPGRGEVLPLSYGVNDIGRGVGARVRLNFGDETVAPDNHAAIIYTTRSRRFYLAHSVSAETRLNNQLVQESIELTGGETLQLGQTRARFVPLCGPDFDWRDSG